MTAGVSIREFAKLDGCNEKLVRRAIAEGRLPKRADGKVDPALAGTEWRQGNAGKAPVGPKARKPESRKAAARPTPAPARPPVEETEADEDDDEPLTDEQREAMGIAALFKTKFQADLFATAHRGALVKLELDLRSGKVVEIEEAARQLAKICRVIKSNLLAIPATIAPELAALRTPTEVRAVLEREIHLVLQELAKLDVAAAAADA